MVTTISFVLFAGTVIEFSKVPVIASLPYYLEQQCFPGGTQRNWNSYGHKVNELTDQHRFILADPQTSGGLLVAVAPEGVAEFEQLLQDQGLSVEHCTAFGWLVDKKSEHVISVI